MKPDRPDAILEEWAAVSSSARRPAAPPVGVTRRSGLPLATLSGAVAIVAVVALAGFVLGRPGPGDVAGLSPSAPASTPPAASPGGTSPAPSIGPVPALCDAVSLTARITLWEGAAGQRIAHVQLTNRGETACLVDDIARPQLVDASGAILIDGDPPASGAQLVVAPGGALETLVSAGNDCGPTPVAPVTLAFILGDGERLVAEPVSPTDATVPPCLGSSQPGTISMHRWAP
jgi:hypothetical protein